MSDDTLDSDVIEKRHIVSLTKSGGITIPKELRDELELNSNTEFELSVEDQTIHLRILDPGDVKKLKEDLKIEEKIRKQTARAVGGKTPKKKKSSKKEFETGKYVAYDFPNKEKVLAVLEKSFGHFKEDPPDIEECLRLVEMAIKAYSTGNRIENSRLRYSVVLFICDMIKKFQLPNLIDFVMDKIIVGMESRFLYEQALLHLALTVKDARPERTLEFIKLIIKNLEGYAETEMYALMHSLESTVKAFTRADFTSDFLHPIREYILGVVEIMERDYQTQAAQLLERMHFIEDALRIVEGILLGMDPESPGIDDLRELKKRLEEKPV